MIILQVVGWRWLRNLDFAANIEQIGSGAALQLVRDVQIARAGRKCFHLFAVRGTGGSELRHYNRLDPPRATDSKLQRRRARVET